MQNVKVDRDKYIENLQGEIWKDIEKYEGSYQVSNYGRVKSLIRYHRLKERILKNKITKDGYYETSLIKNKKHKYIRTHRLVAQAFIENSENKDEVNHINGNKLDNKVENLEWCTSSENQLHAYRIGLQKVSGGAISNRKKIRCIELNIICDSLADMQRKLCELGYTNTKRLNRLSSIINSDNKKYLGFNFELVKEV